MGPEDLAHVLRPFANSLSPELLVGLHTADDAAVYQINETQAVVQTLDFFPPIVDDPYTFGAITAANAMSDVFAMGGRPLFALNIAAWPANLPLEMLTEIFRGGQETVARAGAIIAGGHTVTDEIPKYGLCVTGMVHPGRIATKGGARPGDVLALTKPLGTGIVTTALKAEQSEQGDVDAAVASMMRLNDHAAEAALKAGAVAMTDVTGFGLLGHAFEMAVAGGVALRIRLGTLPVLPGVQRYVADGVAPGGLQRNREYLTDDHNGAPRASWPGDANAAQLAAALDPQTSGGLLIAVAPEHVPALIEHAAALEQHVWVIGDVSEGSGVQVTA